MNAHAIDPHARRRFVGASMLALVASTLAIGSYVGGQRFAIHRVDPPHVDLEVLLASIVPSPPLAVEPPPAPDVRKDDPVEHDDAAKPVDDRDDVDDVLEPVRPKKDGDGRRTVDEGGGGNGDGPKSPLFTGGGVPCPIPGTCTTHVGTLSRHNTDVTRATPVVPISHVRERLRFSPDPSRAELLRTAAGQRGEGGTSIVSFCIDTDGRVADVRTKRSHGDREVDRICRDALSRWRFSPMQVRGKAHRTCSEMSFTIAFE
ncbi:MAG TPA: TonB family protein [Nannocystaceae bacterium]|nr:TonB family protein [Nannocystaceae bacterium]